MSFADVRRLETELGVPLPGDYRSFLTQHAKSDLHPCLLVRHMVPVPGSGEEDSINALYTAQDILQGGMLGEPAENMLVIGSVQPGGYLYMCFAPEKTGSIFVRFPFQDGSFYPVGVSFKAFLERCRPEPESET